MSEALSTRQKVALCAALGTGVVVGATGLVVYQRMCQVSDWLKWLKCSDLIG